MSCVHQERSRNELFEREIVATLDLHGYTRDRAIREMTNFLDDVSEKSPGVQCWVIIITGTGAHSGEGGPVLRSAVHELLQKRKMSFFLNRGRGSFTVDAKSGLVFYKKLRQEDTKLQIVDSVGAGTTSYSRALGSCSSQSRVYPLKHLLKKNSIDLDTKEKIQRQKQQLKKGRKKERMELKQAISDSSIEYKKSILVLKQDEEQLSEVLKLSEQEHKEVVLKEEEMFQNAIKLSQKCHEDEEDSEFQEAISRSQEEQPYEKYTSELEEALQKSMEEQNQEDELLKRIIDLSLKENSQSNFV